MKPMRRIWELQNPTVCKILGMAFNLKDLQKIARKFGLTPSDSNLDQEFALHSTLVQLSQRDNPVARHTEKAIERRFAPYSKKMRLDEPQALINAVTKSPQGLAAPLWAVLWGLATRSDIDSNRVESKIFGHIHMLEHRLVRDYWSALIEGSEDDTETTSKDHEITRLKRALLDMQWANSKLERVVENLKSQISVAGSHRCAKPRNGEAHCTDCARNEAAVAKVRDLKAMVDQIKLYNSGLESENRLLKAEIQELLGKSDKAGRFLADHEERIDSDQPQANSGLDGKKIALVGGIDSLESMYREIVESLGGRFCRHDGKCCNGTKPLEECIVGADLVVCPIEVNSHNAVKTVKKTCKECGVPCSFPRTASLSGLRRAVEGLHSGDKVA